MPNEDLLMNDHYLRLLQLAMFMQHTVQLYETVEETEYYLPEDERTKFGELEFNLDPVEPPKIPYVNFTVEMAPGHRYAVTIRDITEDGK